MAKRTFANPTTKDEWQAAVDAAHACRMIHDAKLYGLVEGGPAVNADRCDEILAAAAALGITPTPFAAERFTDAWNTVNSAAPVAAV